jgi:hypothetical protein
MPIKSFEFERHFKELRQNGGILNKSELEAILGLRNAQKWMQCTLATHFILMTEEDDEDDELNAKYFASSLVARCMYQWKLVALIHPKRELLANSFRHWKRVVVRLQQIEAGEQVLAGKIAGSDLLKFNAGHSADIPNLLFVDDTALSICDSDTSDSDMLATSGCFPCMPYLVKLAGWLGTVPPPPPTAPQNSSGLRVRLFPKIQMAKFKWSFKNSNGSLSSRGYDSLVVGRLEAIQSVAAGPWITSVLPAACW